MAYGGPRRAHRIWNKYGGVLYWASDFTTIEIYARNATCVWVYATLHVNVVYPDTLWSENVHQFGLKEVARYHATTGDIDDHGLTFGDDNLTSEPSRGVHSCHSGI